MKTTRYPRDTLARTVWGEARSERRRGMAAVASVIMNRANNPRWWGRDVVSVCLKPWQFSAWNIDSSQRRLLLEVTESDREFRIALELADLAIAGTLEDETGNSDHFHTLTVRPLWSRGRQPVTTIGRHHFFRLELRAPAAVAVARRA